MKFNPAEDKSFHELAEEWVEAELSRLQIEDEELERLEIESLNFISRPKNGIK